MQQPQVLGSPALDRMAESMTSMADMCKMMMEKEMKRQPLVVAALALASTVLTVALVLLVVLEIQWIRLLGLRIRAEKAKG